MNKGNERTNNAILGFLVGSTVTVLLHQIYRRKETQRHLPLPPSNNSAEGKEEQKTRALEIKYDIPKPGIKVLLVGCGGVGSHVAIMLAKSRTISFLRIVDFDQITLSSLNRHACATLKDVGFSKVNVLKKYIHNNINNNCYVEDRNEMYRHENREELLELLDGSYNWDYVIDAIDDVDTKCELLTECYKRNLKVISCMGAGGKSDPTRIHIGDLKVASRDPLAAKIRTRLKKGGVVSIQDWDNLQIVHSSEKVVVKLAELSEEQKKNRGKYGAVDGMRVRVIPVLGTMPAIMGQTIAAWVVSQVEGRPFWPSVSERVGKEVRHKIYQHFKNREKKIYDAEVATKDTSSTANNNEKSSPVKEKSLPKFESSQAIITSNKWVGPPQVDLDDINYLLTEIWQNKCAVSGERVGTVLGLTRWDNSKPSIGSNLVLMGNQALKKLDASGKHVLGENVVQRIETRLKWLEENESFGR